MKSKGFKQGLTLGRAKQKKRLYFVMHAAALPFLNLRGKSIFDHIFSQIVRE